MAISEQSPPRPAEARLKIERVESADGLRALFPEWQELLRRCPDRSLCQTPVWLGTWWQVFGGGRELCVLTARDPQGELRGIAPLLLRTVRHRGLVPLRRLELLGTGEPEADEVASNYVDFLTDSEWEPWVTAAFAQALAGELADAWDELYLTALPAESLRARELPALLGKRGCRAEALARTPGVYVSLEDGWEAAQARMHAGHRKSLRRRRRRLEEAGEVRFDWATGPQELRERWPILRSLHERGWAARGGTGCFHSAPFREFHRQVTEYLLPRGGVRLAVLSLNGEPLAADFYYLYHGRVYAYQAGLDPERGRQLSAGTIGIACGMEAAAAEGLEEYDFLRGVSEYKTVWSDARREQLTLRIARPGLRETLRGTIEAGVSAVRPLRSRLRRPV
ncbi:MAG: GNAT family N-acetyltransferase [Armatimonadota bacterium]